jgi:hypothetical protein
MILPSTLEKLLAQFNKEQLAILLVDPNSTFRQIAQYEIKRRNELLDEK